MTIKFIKLFDTGDAVNNTAKPSSLEVATALQTKGYECSDYIWATVGNNGGSITVAWEPYQGQSITKLHLYTPNPTEETYLQYYHAGAIEKSRWGRQATKYNYELAYNNLSGRMTSPEAMKLRAKLIDKHIPIVKTYLEWNQRIFGELVIPLEGSIDILNNIKNGTEFSCLIIQNGDTKRLCRYFEGSISAREPQVGGPVRLVNLVGVVEDNRGKWRKIDDQIHVDCLVNVEISDKYVA